ncbi:MAG: hypothetical protein WCH98_12770 [Verrucomicrobiota bacterium]
MNIQVFQIIAIVLVALAVPLALVTLGISRYSSKPEVPEAPGLRAALEQAADKSWSSPEPLAGDRRVFTFSTPGNETEARKAVEQSARTLNGVVVPMTAGQRGEGRLLVRIPATNSHLFESAALLRNFAESQQGHPTGESHLYEIVFPAP